MTNPNILSERYATPKMNEIWSETGKITSERELWVAVMKAQKDLGLNIPAEDIEKFENAINDIDLQRIKEREARTRHDVKAKIEEYVAVSGAGQHIQRGMTSRDLTDNVEQMQIRKSAELIRGRYVSVLRHMTDKAVEYEPIVLTARTHHQPAQPTLLGRRFSMWAEELLYHLDDFEGFVDKYPLRGMKGPVGTRSDMLALLGSHEKVEELEKRIAQHLGFKNVLDSTGQPYPRSLDYELLSHLSFLAAAPENFANGMRLMAGDELVTEGFGDEQSGSSAMPHKMNTRTCERIWAASQLLKMYADGASRISGEQWEEGDVSDSMIRRVILPDAFYTSDGLCEATLTVLNEMGAYPEMIRKELDAYLPFLASTQILGLATRHGIGREEAHKTIKRHAVAVANDRRQRGVYGNDLVERLSQDPSFSSRGITYQMMDEIVHDTGRLLGNARRQIAAVKEKAEPLLSRYAEAAAYEPRPIL